MLVLALCLLSIELPVIDETVFHCSDYHVYMYCILFYYRCNFSVEI